MQLSAVPRPSCCRSLRCRRDEQCTFFQYLPVLCLVDDCLVSIKDSEDLEAIIVKWTPGLVGPLCKMKVQLSELSQGQCRPQSQELLLLLELCCSCRRLSYCGVTVAAEL